MQASAAILGAAVLLVACGGPAKGGSAFASSTKGALTAFAVAPASGKVDRVGTGDGAFSPDGTPDLVFTAELDGPAVAMAIASVDGRGSADGAFSADTLVGEQTTPIEISSDVRLGKSTAGVAVYEGDALRNAPDGSLPMFAPGHHSLTIHVSPSSMPRGPFRAYAVFDDHSVAESPVAR